MLEDASRIGELRRALWAKNRSAYIVEARVIRRLIREHYGLANLTIELPHTNSQIVTAQEVLRHVHPDELGLASFEGLSDVSVLLCAPTAAQIDHWPMEELKQLIWRRHFHARIDLEVQRSERSSDVGALRDRIACLGQAEFDEAHYVLRSEFRLISPGSRREAWQEIVSQYFEFLYFEPDLLPIWFPSLHGLDHVEKVLSRELDIEALYLESCLDGCARPELIPHAAMDEEQLLKTRRNWSFGLGVSKSDRGYLRRLRIRDRANERGNTVHAATSAILAAQRAPSEAKRIAAEEKTQQDVRHLVERLRNAIHFAEQDQSQWETALRELANNSAQGFWNVEKRLLYDLQRVCLDHERRTYKVDIVKWVVSRGQRPLRRPLDSLREVAMAKHLASASLRLTRVRLSGVERDRLTYLIQHAAKLSESQMRERMRPILKQTLLSVDLTPQSIPEQVAFDKLIEEAMDCIATRGYLTMGYLRDAISKNDLKLPDLGALRDVLRGDQLLRVDDQLDVALDGVYRRGEFYLRWLQVVSSFFFGTGAGRFATLFIIIPFGGSMVIVEGVTHVLHSFQHRAHKHVTANVIPSASEKNDTGAEGQNTVATTGESIGDKQNNPVEPPESENETATEMPLDWLAEESNQTIAVTPKTTDEAVSQIISRQSETIALVLILGLILMGLIHVGSFRKFCVGILSGVWNLVKGLLVETPLLLLRMPILNQVWNANVSVFLRRFVCWPGIVTVFAFRTIPNFYRLPVFDWWSLVPLGLCVSLAINSRIGRDMQESSRDWLINAIHQLHARLLFAFIGWVVDFFRILLSTLERVLYAVDEWLRFHSDENWLTIIAKAILGVIWSFVSFLIRIYVNLLIEPTFHPVKHFPVVTVAHKIFLPALIMLEGNMVHFLGQYLGTPLARSLTWFNIFFLPGFFGFAVWELKENWKLYRANRKDRLLPVTLGSHGETVARLIRPGFHSGTLPKLFRRMRKLEVGAVSVGRFTKRRSTVEQLHHVEHAIESFVDREFVGLLQKSQVWTSLPIECWHVRVASNSFSIELKCPSINDSLVTIRIQDQSGWLVAYLSETGWLAQVTDEQLATFHTALEGFYRKCGIDLIREQIEENFTKKYPYDIDEPGLMVWPTDRMDVEIVTGLKQSGMLRPFPTRESEAAGLMPIQSHRVVFSATQTSWREWEETWNGDNQEFRPSPFPLVLRERRNG